MELVSQVSLEPGSVAVVARGARERAESAAECRGHNMGEGELGVIPFEGFARELVEALGHTKMPPGLPATD
jgi:tripartite-type tricarboxylate transporter receptor subunit TctC